jgi:hypothetical protein
MISKFFLPRNLPRAFQSRQLWNLTPPKPVIVIGNNTALFAVLASLQSHGTEKHPHLHLICPSFWLDFIHPYYWNEKWGQSVTGIPKMARDMFLNMYPTYAKNKFITWGQMQELRQTALHLIEHHYHIPIYHGDPNIKRLADGRFEIYIKNSSDQDKKLDMPSDTQFYFWYKIPNLHELEGIRQSPSTDLYQMHPSEIPEDKDLVVLGDGLSVIWLAKFFANTSTKRNIICIKPKSGKLNLNVPSNACVDPKRIITLNTNESIIKVSPEDPRMVRVYSKVYQKEFPGFFYSAIGSEIPYHLVKEVPQNQLMSPSQWIPSAWIAPKNIPRGSLMESILQWFAITNNLDWGAEPQSYHSAANQFNLFVKQHFSSQLRIDEKYFDTLDAVILNQYL